jgi:NAD(P)-dependent dehydrogenase (short-subunit alcohol dehydrogenase family)
MTHSASPIPGPLAGRHAVVTGAAQGIGSAIARSLAAQGARLTLMGRRLTALQALASDLPGGACAFSVDVSDEAAVQHAFAAARATHGPVSVLVNNAGQAESAPFGKTSLALWQRMIAVNLTGTFLCTQQALPDMLAVRQGRIVNIASTAGQRGYAYVSAYVAAKHGVVGLTRALALEVAAKGITVNAVCPGYTETEILQASIAKVVATTGRSEAQARAEFEKSNPQGRIVQPDEVAQAVLWLVSDAAAALTGQCISVSGGEVM